MLGVLKPLLVFMLRELPGHPSLPLTLKTHFNPHFHLWAESSCWNSGWGREHVSFQALTQVQAGRLTESSPLLPCPGCAEPESSPLGEPTAQGAVAQPAQPRFSWCCHRTEPLRGCGVTVPCLPVQAETRRPGRPLSHGKGARLSAFLAAPQFIPPSSVSPQIPPTLLSREGSEELVFLLQPPRKTLLCPSSLGRVPSNPPRDSQLPLVVAMQERVGSSPHCKVAAACVHQDVEL